MPSVVRGHVGRGSPAIGSQDRQLTDRDPGKRPAPKQRRIRGEAELPCLSVGPSISSPGVLSILEELRLIINRDKTSGKFAYLAFKICLLLQGFFSSIGGRLGGKFTENSVLHQHKHDLFDFCAAIAFPGSFSSRECPQKALIDARLRCRIRS